MALSARFDAYVALERAMLELDEAGDPMADSIRDLMDPIWYALTDEEHAQLDARGTIGSVASLHPIRLPAGPDVLTGPSVLAGIEEPEKIVGRPVGLTAAGWELAA